MASQNSVFGTFVNIIANLVGAGLLSLPATLMQAGLGTWSSEVTVFLLNSKCLFFATFSTRTRPTAAHVCTEHDKHVVHRALM